MKSLTTIVFCVLLSFATYGNTSEVLTSEMLTHQNWVRTDLSDLNIYFEFQEPGILDIIHNENGRIIWTTSFWELSHIDGQDFLIIRKNIGQDHVRFHIALVSTHLVLSNQSDEIVLHTELIRNIDRPDIIGKWKSPFYHKRSGKIATSKTNPSKMWKLGFEFNKDGTFSRHIQLGSYVEAETGVWNLSSDGKFIKLHFTLNGNVEDIYKKEVFNIENYQGENMRLSTDSESENILDEFELLKS